MVLYFLIQKAGIFLHSYILVFLCHVVNFCIKHYFILCYLLPALCQQKISLALNMLNCLFLSDILLTIRFLHCHGWYLNQYLENLGTATQNG